MLTTEATHCDAACQDASHLQRAQQLSELQCTALCQRQAVEMAVHTKACEFHQLACRMAGMLPSNLAA